MIFNKKKAGPTPLKEAKMTVIQPEENTAPIPEQEPQYEDYQEEQVGDETDFQKKQEELDAEIARVRKQIDELQMKKTTPVKQTESVKKMPQKAQQQISEVPEELQEPSFNDIVASIQELHERVTLLEAAFFRSGR